MLVAAVLLIVTGRSGDRPRPFYTVAGPGRRLGLHRHLDDPRQAVASALRGAGDPVRLLRVSREAALETRPRRDGGRGGDGRLAGDRLPWQPELRAQPLGVPRSTSPSSTSARTLVNLNVKTQHDEEVDLTPEQETHETEEYGGFLLMLDTVPGKSAYDYGASYIRLVSTYIPRLVWHDKPIFGREQWVNAWIAGSEFKRDSDFTGPAIGILGATQLNGGAWGTLIVLGIVAILLRTAYEYFRRYQSVPWVQAWWSLTFFNAWLMTVNDDPFVWFYYIYGHTTVPPLAFLWICLKYSSRAGGSSDNFGAAGRALSCHRGATPNHYGSTQLS